METRCSVQPYTECSMGMVPQQLNRTKLAPKLFVEKTCTQVCHDDRNRLVHMQFTHCFRMI